MTLSQPIPLVFASLGSAALGWIMFLLSIFLILLVLVQRGKGGGLTGALGGPGGQSAFGSKAGDTFTLITAVSAIIWGFVCAVAMYTLGVPPTTAAEEEFQFDTPAAVTSPSSESSDGGLGGLSGLDDLLNEPSDDNDSPASLTPADSTSAEQGTPSAELSSGSSDTDETKPESDSDSSETESDDSSGSENAE